MYTALVQSVIDGTFVPQTHFYGINDGAIDITPLNPNLAAPGTEAVVEAARRRFQYESYKVFDGVIETNDGRTVGVIGETLSDDVILSGIDWYFRNIVE